MNITIIKKYFIKSTLALRGFSILELLITLGIFAILLVMITSILVINLKLSRQIEARTKVREETSFLLKLMKKDIRNAVLIEETDNGLRVDVVPAVGGATESKCWYYEPNETKVSRGAQCSSDCLQCDNGEDFRTPGDVEINAYTITVNPSTDGKNKLIILELQATTKGMPDDEFIKKRVGISTRTY